MPCQVHSQVRIWVWGVTASKVAVVTAAVTYLLVIGMTQYRTLDFRYTLAHTQTCTHSGTGVEAYMALWEGVVRREGMRIYGLDKQRAVVGLCVLWSNQLPVGIWRGTVKD